MDGDNDQDVLITGSPTNNSSISKLYTNDGNGNFTEMMGTPFDSVYSGSIAFADVDGDNDQDVLITGSNSGTPISKLYTNGGTGNFTEVTGTPFEGVKSSSIAFADVDGDNDLDVLVTGENSSGVPISKLYKNDGRGNFTEVTGTSIDGVETSSVAFADVDGDNDLDVLITGEGSSGAPISKLYSNDGMGNFTEVTGSPFADVEASSIAFVDVDGDSDQDVFISGSGNGNFLISKLYTNDGAGNFTEVTGTPFESVFLSSIAFADVDGDSDQDILITGWNRFVVRISKLYTNDQFAVSNDDLMTYTLDFTPYPNPTKADNLYINYITEENTPVTIKVYDLNGHLLFHQKEFALIGQQAFSLDISFLTQGSYFIELNDGKRKRSRKFLVN